MVGEEILFRPGWGVIPQMPRQKQPMDKKRATVVFTDLDGTLLDSKTYSFDAARETLDQLHTRSIPVVVVSSKTRAEIEPLRSQLHNEHPFIVENGGAVVVPAKYFAFPLPDAIMSGGYHLVELGTPYPQLRTALKDIEQKLGMDLRGYGDMTVDEVARETGLSRQDAELATQRDYDEPFLIIGGASAEHRVTEAITARGLSWTKGDRYFHLMGAQDKGRAVRYLTECYRRKAHEEGAQLSTVAIGNSLNDAPMLAQADQAVLVQQADGSYAPGIDLPHLIHAPGPGPVGWSLAILSLLRGS